MKILAYLAEAFPVARLPPMSEERADYYRWMFFAAGPVEQTVTNHRAGFAPAPEQESFSGYGSYQRTVDQLERAVQSPHSSRATASPLPIYTSAPTSVGASSSKLCLREPHSSPTPKSW